MKIKVNGTNEKRMVPKYAENGGLQEARDDRGNVIISETKLRKIFPPDAKLMSYRKRIYVHVRYVQNGMPEYLVS